MSVDKVASAIVKEVPTGSINNFLGAFAKQTASDSNGTGCGQGCGAGCTDGVGLVFDRYGHSGISTSELQSAVKDAPGLRAAVATQLNKAASGLK